MGVRRKGPLSWLAFMNLSFWNLSTTNSLGASMNSGHNPRLVSLARWPQAGGRAASEERTLVARHEAREELQEELADFRFLQHGVLRNGPRRLRHLSTCKGTRARECCAAASNDTVSHRLPEALQQGPKQPVRKRRQRLGFGYGDGVAVQVHDDNPASPGGCEGRPSLSETEQGGQTYRA